MSALFIGGIAAAAIFVTGVIMICLHAAKVADQVLGDMEADDTRRLERMKTGRP